MGPFIYQFTQDIRTVAFPSAGPCSILPPGVPIPLLSSQNYAYRLVVSVSGVGGFPVLLGSSPVAIGAGQAGAPVARSPDEESPSERVEPSCRTRVRRETAVLYHRARLIPRLVTVMVLERQRATRAGRCAGVRGAHVHVYTRKAGSPGIMRALFRETTVSLLPDASPARRLCLGSSPAPHFSSHSRTQTGPSRSSLSATLLHLPLSLCRRSRARSRSPPVPSFFFAFPARSPAVWAHSRDARLFGRFHSFNYRRSPRFFLSFRSPFSRRYTGKLAAELKDFELVNSRFSFIYIWVSIKIVEAGQ